MRVVITRPSSEARHWADSVRAAGHEPVLIPLIGIEPLADGANLQKAWRQLGENAAAMFVSGNAVHFFMLARPLTEAGQAAEPIRTRAWATGPGTRQALLACGWPGHLIDTPHAAAIQFDSEALWAVVKLQLAPGHKVLVVRGETVAMPSHRESRQPCGTVGTVLGQALDQAPGTGRDWLAQKITEAGALPVFCISYLRRVPDLSTEHMRQIRGAVGTGVVWLFSSSEALNNLTALVPGENWARACAVATHPRIAQSAQAAGFGTVRVTRPTVVDVLASIESLA